MRILFIILMLLGLLCAILGLYGSAQTQARMTLLISNLADLRTDRPAEVAELERLAARASVQTRESHKRLIAIGWIAAGLGFFGAMLRRPEEKKPPANWDSRGSR